MRMRLLAQGKTVKIVTVGRKGADNLRRDLGRNIVERIELKGIRQLGFVNAEDIGKKLLAMFEAGEFDVATLYFSEFKSVIAQKPDGAADHSGQASGGRRGCEGRRARKPSSSTSPTRTRSWVIF